MLLEIRMPKMKKYKFFSFFIYHNFSYISTFTLNFCVVICKNVEKSQASIEERLSMKLQLMQTFLKNVPQKLWEA